MSPLNESVVTTTVVRSGGGSAPTDHRPLDRLDPIDEGSGPVDIVPSAADNGTPTPDIIHARRVARVDGCPDCVANYEAPKAVLDDGDGGFFASYVCADCGHAWLTNWRD